MSSNVQLRAPLLSSDDRVPFDSYAQIVRMLLPLTDKVSFYDATGQLQWITDGVEEPELRMHVEILLGRCAHDGAGLSPVDYSASDEGRPTYVFPIRARNQALMGALAIVFRDTPSNTTYRRLETVERLLAPVLDILSYSYRTERSTPKVVAAAKPVQAHSALKLDEDVPVEPKLDVSALLTSPLPGALRRSLTLVTDQLQCAFGALIGVERPFTLSHRLSPDESDLTMNSAIDAVRAPMLKLMQVRKDAVLVNGSTPGRAQLAPYKFLVLPLRPDHDRLAAVLVLFRHKQARDFIAADVHEVLEVFGKLPPAAMTGLLPSAAQSPREPTARAMQIDPKPSASNGSDLQATHSKLNGSKSRVDAPMVTSKIVVPPTLTRPAAATTALPLVITADAAPTMDERIRTALRNGMFDLYAQKISPLRDEQRPARFEVLVRMQDAERLRTPPSFFEAAEAGTLLPDLDRWVIRKLLSTLRNNAALVRSGRWEFCINIAAQSLITDHFSDFIVAEVCKSSIPAGLLVFEISECDALEHQHALELLGARLRDVGCRIALDNCRAGLTTFGPLHKWPVSCVKVDGSLIRNVTTNKRSESVVRAVAQLASSMGIETVAERVESPELCNALLDMGFDYAQGFHFGQPEPLVSLFR